MPFFFDQAHYAAVVAVLTAAEVQARVVQTGDGHGVEVQTEVGDRIVWSNQERQRWLCTIVGNEDGEVTAAGGDLDMDSVPEHVAAYIANYDYGDAALKKAEGASSAGD